MLANRLSQLPDPNILTLMLQFPLRLQMGRQVPLGQEVILGLRPARRSLRLTSSQLRAMAPIRLMCLQCQHSSSCKVHPCLCCGEHCLMIECQCHRWGICKGRSSSDLHASASHTLVDTVTTPVTAAVMMTRTTTVPSNVTTTIAMTVTTWLYCYWHTTVMLSKLKTICTMTVT